MPASRLAIRAASGRALKLFRAAGEPDGVSVILVLREETAGPLPPVEQGILDRILGPAVAALSVRERHEALSQGRNQPLSATIAHALTQVPALRRHQPT